MFRCSLALFALLVLETSCTSSDDEVAAPPPMVYARLYRLTEVQYRQQLEDVLAVDASVELQVPYDTPANGFTSIGAGQNGISSVDTDLYATNAYRVADATVADPARVAALVACDAGDDACFHAATDQLLLRLFRRPITDAQRTAFRSLEVLDASGRIDIPGSLRLIIATALQSPAFLYRIDRGTGVRQPNGDRALDSYEQAARLAAFFWNSAPDAQLLAAAHDGSVLTSAQLDRMAASPRFAQSMFGFMAELFQLETVLTTPKGALYFGITDADRVAMHAEGEYLLRDIAQGGDFRRLYTTNDTFMTPELAVLYGIDSTIGASSGRATLDPSLRRGGVLGRSLFLMVNSHATSTSPTMRGKFIRTRLLCETIPPPPPGASVDLSPHEGDAPTTLRQRLETMHAQGGCASCHSRMDPLGFALEGFDVYGRARATEENGLPIDSHADFDGVPVSGGDELGAAMAQRPELGACMTRQMFRFALGRLEYPDEETELAALAEQLAAGGYELRSLARAIAEAPSFATVRLREPEGATP